MQVDVRCGTGEPILLCRNRLKSKRFDNWQAGNSFDVGDRLIAAELNCIQVALLGNCAHALGRLVREYSNEFNAALRWHSRAHGPADLGYLGGADLAPRWRENKAKHVGTGAGSCQRMFGGA
jgi:hypothetical protein